MANKILIGSPASCFQNIYSATTLTASASGAAIVGVERFTTAEFLLSVDAGMTGTGETLDVYIQTLLPDGAPGAGSGTWQDIIHFAQVTTSASEQIAHFVTGASSVAAVQTAALAAATIKAISMGCIIRVRCIVGGTNPSYPAVDVFAHFLE